MSAKVIMLSHLKGGVGKSTLSVNLGAALKAMGHKVAIFDIDLSTSTSTMFQAYAENYARSLPDHTRTLPDVVRLKVDHDISPMLRRLALKSQLSPLLTAYDYVVIDAGAGATAENVDAMEVTDLVIVPSVPSETDIPPTIKYVDDLTRFIPAVRSARTVHARVIINKADPRSSATGQLAELFRNHSTEVELMTAMIPDRKSLASLMKTGSTVFDRTRVSDQQLQRYFTLMAEECIEILAGEPAVAA